LDAAVWTYIYKCLIVSVLRDQMRKIEKIFISGVEFCSKIANSVGLYHLLRSRTRNKVPILMYHGVTSKHNPVANFDGKHVAKETFEKQLMYLKKHYSIISLDEFIEWKQGKRETLPKNAIVITFDDGYKNCYTTLYPLLKQYNVTGTIFLPTAYIRKEKEKEQIAWYDIVPYCIDETKKEQIKIDGKEYSLRNEKEKIAAILEIKNTTRDFPDKRMKIIKQVENETGIKASNCKKEDFLFMSWENCRKMQGNGITFGSHTVTHQVLTMQTREEVVDEFKVSKKIIEHELHNECTTLAYPFGNNNQGTRDILQETKYLAGLTTTYGLNTRHVDSTQLLRITISNKSTLSLFMLTLVCNFPRLHHSIYVFYNRLKKRTRKQQKHYK
jgi:peptidoglycan/xylan/chitin deacetylase (PgdA/CDA1 family)